MHQELYQQGLALAESGQFAAAITLFDQVLQVCPNDAVAYYQRGLAYFKTDQVEAAISDYTRSLMSDASNANLYYARALAHLRQRSYEPAVADAKDAIRLRAEFAAAYHLLGTVRQQQNWIDKAVASYKQAAKLYLSQQDQTNGRRCLELIQQIQQPVQQPVQPSNSPTPAAPPPLTPDEFLQRTIEKAKLKNYRSAIEDLDWAIHIDPHDPRPYICRAEIKANVEDWSGAIADYRQAARQYLDQGDQTKAQMILNRIDQLQVVSIYPTPVKPVKPTRPASRYAAAPNPIRPAGRVSAALQLKLLRLVSDDRKIAAGLVESLRQRHPGMPEDWYWEKAIYDLERDRR